MFAKWDSTGHKSMKMYPYYDLFDDCSGISDVHYFKIMG